MALSTDYFIFVSVTGILFLIKIKNYNFIFYLAVLLVFLIAHLAACFIVYCIYALQELLGLKTMSDSQCKVYTYRLPADVEVLAFNHFKLLHRSNHT